MMTNADTEKSKAVFVPDKISSALAYRAINNGALIDFWHNFSFMTSRLTVKESEDMIFSLGKARRPRLDGYAYAINIEKDGIFIAAKDERSLVNGFMRMLGMMEMKKSGQAELACCEIRESPRIKLRMTHFCVFPETQLWELARFIKFCAALNYSHVIVEFWGMLKLDCLKESAWEHGYTKEQIKPIIRLANELGIEIVPMYNCWGHASGSRAMHGKHVVLSQNLSLQYLFCNDGWRWRIENPQVRELLRQIRAEFKELCGSGQYFHIGCDEAYGFGYTADETDEITDYINEISAELRREGRRAIMWADMLLSARSGDAYSCGAPNKQAEEYIISRLDKSIITADWQYDIKNYPVETSLALKKAGFKVLVCPWDLSTQCSDACVKTAAEHGLEGIIHTTWHTLASGYAYVSRVADGCWNERKDLPMTGYYGLKTAEILRKISPNVSYEKAGWSKNDTGVGR